MSRDLFTNKWVLGTIVFLIVFGVACILWYHYDTAPYKRDAAKTERIVKQWQNANKVVPESETNDTSLDHRMSPAEKPKIETVDGIPEEGKNLKETLSSSTDETQEIESQKIVSVSPHGFGPFPEVPEDYIIKPFSWDFYKNDPPIHELMARVRIKLWKQGIQTTGITSSSATGLVYPTIPGAVFVNRYYRDGVDYLEIRGDPALDLEAIRKELMVGNVRDGIQVLDMDEAGIDPYKFLNLSK